MHKMTGVPPGLLCIGALLALLLQGAWAESIQSPAPNLTANQNSSLQGNITPDQSRAVIPGVVLGSGASRAGKVLRAGFQKNRTINDLDVYGNRSVHVIPPQVPA